MNRAEKEIQITEVAKTLSSAASVYLVNLSGLTVPQVTDLRRKIKAAKGSCRVVKNRLAMRGSKGTASEALSSFFRGPIGIVAHHEEPVSLAKILTDFAKDHPAFALKAAVVDGHVVDSEVVKRIASLPGLKELRAMLLNLITQPAVRLARVIATPGQQTARVIEERRKQLGGE